MACHWGSGYTVAYMEDPVSPTPESAAEVTYKDDDVVYVDPDERRVLGMLEWTPAGRPKSLLVPGPAPKEGDEDVKPERKRRRKFFPMGTYRSLKKIYKIEGKIHEQRPMLTLDEAIVKAMQEPFWD